MQVTALGTGGWMPAQNRAGLSTMVESKGQLLIFELGTGISRLLEPNLRENIFAKYDEIHVILSHFHLDHVIGLSYLPAVVGDKPVHLYSPGRLLGLSTKACLERLFTAPFFSSPPSSWEWLVSVSELSEGVQFIGEVELRVRMQDHIGGSLGFVVDNKFAQITDTTVDPLTVDFIQGCQLLFHECWYLAEAEKSDHAHLPGVVSIAAEAGVSKAGLIHLNPQIPDERYVDEIRKISSEAEICVVKDLEVFNL